MKQYTPVILVFVLFGCVTQPSITLVNKTSVLLTDQPLVLTPADLGLASSQYAIFSNVSEQPIPAQFDDLDQDGSWDEVALELNFEPNQELVLTYQVVSKDDLPEFKMRTSARLGYSPQRNGQFESVDSHVRPTDHVAQSLPFLYQFEGPGWEGELVAFRAYFDSRNGKDIFGKTSPDLTIDKIGLGDNYHELQDWGMDILKVGSSLGAGAIGILKNDSIYRLTNTGKATFDIITQGPVRSVIKLTYQDWEVDGTNYDLTETISIWAGKRHYTSELTLSGNGTDTLVTGIVDLKDVVSSELEGYGSKIIYTHGAQSESGDVLGMGIIVPEDNFFAFGEAPKSGSGVTDTYTVLLKPSSGRYEFAFYVGWALENPEFQIEEYFSNSIKAETTSFNNSIELKK